MSKFFFFLVLILSLLAVPVFSQIDFGNEPMDVVITIDTSKSVHNLSTIKKAMQAWMKNVLKPGDRVCIIKFANKPEKSPSFTVTDSNLSNILKHFPEAPSSDGDYTDLASAVMESLLQLTDYYYDEPDKRKQILLMVSDFVPDPPQSSPYFNRNDTPYITYKEAEKKCLQGYEPFQLMSVKIKAFALKAPLDSMGGELDEWWIKFLSSLSHKKPQNTPVPVKTPGNKEDKKLLDELIGLYKKENSALKIDIKPVDNNTDWGKVPLKGATVKKDFKLVNNYDYSVIKDISVRMSIEDFSGPVPEIKFMNKSASGNYIKIEKLSPHDSVPLSIEIVFPGAGNFNTISQADGKLTFTLEGLNNPVETYKGKSIAEPGLKNDLKDKKDFTFHLVYEKSAGLLYLAGIIAIIFVVILLCVLFIKLAGSVKPISVSIKMEGMPPVIHTYELASRGSIDIIGGTFSTPDQFELPNVEGTAAVIQRKGNKFFLVPEKASIINDTGDSLDGQKEIKFGDHFTLRMENMSGTNTDFSFEFQKAGTEDISDGLDSILDEDSSIAGTLDTGDLL
ncbi:MAG: vWA domain-containing protein [Candidatus Eremiobacterota bacterium]